MPMKTKTRSVPNYAELAKHYREQRDQAIHLNIALVDQVERLQKALELLKDRWAKGKASTKDWKQIDAALGVK